MSDPLSLDNRKRIYEFIISRPGTHVREMSRELDMQPGVLTHHLDRLEREGLVSPLDDGYRLRYYALKSFIHNNRKIVNILRQDRPKAIMQYVLKIGSPSFQQLQTELGITKSTLSHHLKKMVSGNLLIAERVEREIFYRAYDPDHVVEVMLLMDRGSTNDIEERFADIWGSLRP